MAGVTKSSTVSTIVDTIIAEARYTFMHKTVMVPLVRKYTLPKGSNTITVPKFGTLTIAALTEGVDMASPQQLSVSSQANLTASEVGGQVILTDTAIKYATEDIHRTTGRLLGEAMAKNIDQALLTLFSSFSTHSIGTSSVPLIPSLISAGYFRLKGQAEPAPDPIMGVFHPYNFKDLMDALTLTSAISSNASYDGNMTQGVPQKLLTAGFAGVTKLYGIPIYMSGNIATTSGSINGVFSKEAIIYVADKEPTTETERDASLRGYEINHTSRYGAKIYQESYGVLITCDATAPTT